MWRERWGQCVHGLSFLTCKHEVGAQEQGCSCSHPWLRVHQPIWSRQQLWRPGEAVFVMEGKQRRKLMCNSWQQSFSCFFLFPSGAWWSGVDRGYQSLFMCWPVWEPCNLPCRLRAVLAPKLQEMQGWEAGCCCEIAQSAEPLQISASYFVFKWTKRSSCMCCPLEAFKIKKRRSCRVIPLVFSMMASLYTLKCPTQALMFLAGI